MTLSKNEERILNSISVPSTDDPHRPEFPPYEPRFPATPTYKIKVPGFSNVWLKDDSINRYSGTHKDRIAWEVVVLYRNFLIAKKLGQYRGVLPKFSIISSGSAAVAIGRMLKDYGLPKLKVVVDKKISPEIYDAIRRSHCEIFVTDLSKRLFGPDEVLAMTKNKDGFDLTSNRGAITEIGNYDWMGYEILNRSPEYCFIPFGTGILYSKVLELNKLEVGYAKHDHRFHGNIDVLRRCNFMGVTTNNPNSKADKLFAHYISHRMIDDELLRFYKRSGFCGPMTGIYLIKERYLDQAMEIARAQEVICEPSGVSGLALMLQMKDSLPKNKKMLIVNTGKLKLMST